MSELRAITPRDMQSASAFLGDCRDLSGMSHAEAVELIAEAVLLGWVPEL